MRTLQRFGTRVLFGLALALTSTKAAAQVGAQLDSCPRGINQGACGLALFLQTTVIEQVLIAFEGIAMIFMFYYAAQLIFEAHNESALTNARKSFIYAFIGFATMAAAYRIVDAFLIQNGLGVNSELLSFQLDKVATFLLYASAGILTLSLLFNAFRLLMSQGDEGLAETARKGIVQNIVGVVVILLADIGIATIGTGNVRIAIVELIGIANFLLQLTGAAAVVALLTAGIMLIISVDESLKERAKTIVTGTLITLVFVIASYTLITIFVS